MQFTVVVYFGKLKLQYTCLIHTGAFLCKKKIKNTTSSILYKPV